MHRVLPTVLALSVPLLLAAPAAGYQLGTTNGDPKLGCDGGECTVASDRAAPGGGTITSFQLRYADAKPGDTVAFKTLSPTADGYSYRVVRTTAEVALPESSATTTATFSIPDGLALASGEHIGAFVRGASVRFIHSEPGSGTGTSSQSGNLAPGESGSTFWSSLSGTELLLLAEVQGAADSQPGGGAPDGTDPGDATPGGSNTGGSTTGGATGGGVRYCRASSPRPAVVRPATDRVRPTATPGASGTARVTRAPRRSAWPRKVLDRSDSWTGVHLALDPKGRRHLTGGGFRNPSAYYLGPDGKRVIERVGPPVGDVGLALVGSTPVVAYQKLLTETEPTEPGLVGRSHSCDVLRVAVGPRFNPTVVRAMPENEHGFFRLDLASAGNALHAAYSIGRGYQLSYQRFGERPQSLPFEDLDRLDVDASGQYVAVAASRNGKLVVFTRKGSGAWRKISVARGVGSWAMALGRDGRPRLAFRDRKLSLSLFNGRRVVSTRLAAENVGIALDGKGRMHVAFTRSPGPTPNADAPERYGWIRLYRNGIFHLRTNRSASRASLQLVQGALGQSVGLAVAVFGRRVDIAFGDAGNSGALTVRSKTL